MVGTGMVGLGSTFSVSMAAADGSTADPVTILEDDQKFSLARDLADTTAFEMLLAKADKLGYSFKWSADNLFAARTETEQLKREVVEYRLDEPRENVDAMIVVARDMEADTVEVATLDLEYHTAEGLWLKTEKYELVDGAIEQRTLEPDGDALQRAIDELEAGREATTAQDGVTTQVDLPDVIKVNECSQCYEASKLLCTAVCNAGGTLSCLLLGITVVGSIACTTFVKAVCFVAKKASGCGNRVAATICKPSGIGACGPDQKPGGIIQIDIPYL
ncbi:halocin C8-like domain-containing protein [Halorussus pelagicus]|uniref:halocin C8-like domain-containing protein n=1 Tax=Halorussus pelagicus TaxID=2505977 RepID=UPI00140751A3|nr:halocin C8-like domain-containing protein [Halorussus pelagicus]